MQGAGKARDGCNRCVLDEARLQAYNSRETVCRHECRIDSR